MPSRTLSSKLVVGSNTYTDTDIVDMSLESNLVPGEEFTLGTTICNKFEATIMTDNKIMALNVVKPYIGLDVNGTVEEVPLGVFNVDDVKEVKGNKQIVAYDNMMKLEKAYFSDLTYPTTIQAVANEIAQKAGVAFNGTLPSYTIDKIEGKTLRESIGIIAGICGGFARINRLGQLEIVQLTSTDISITPDNFFNNLEKADKGFTIKKITAIKEDNSTITAGSGLASEEITFSNNFITQTMLNNILTTYNNYSYMPLKVNWQGNPAIDVGDIISITDIDDTVYQIPVMRLKLTYSGGLKSEISSVAKSESKSEYSYKGSISKKVEVLATEQANIKVLMAQKATIEDLEATNAEIDVLKTNKADISALTSINAAISNLQANKANISDLDTINASIDNLQTNKADITQLNAATVRIGTLESDVANIETILSKDVFSELATVGKIVAGSQIIAEGAIGSAQISDLSASKLTAGIIDAAIITVKNLNADNITVGSINGQRIANGAIDNSKIATNANIDGSKLNISSVVTQINNGTTTIQGSKISVDDGTLDVKFSTLKNTVNSYGESISTHSSQISALDNAIKLKVDTQTYNTKITNLDNSISVINTNLNKATSDISILQGEITSKVSQTDINNSINAITIGGRNLLLGSQKWADESFYLKSRPSFGAIYDDTQDFSVVTVPSGSTSVNLMGVPVKGGDSITVSIDVMYADYDSAQRNLLLSQYYVDNVRESYEWEFFTNVNFVSGQWYRISFTRVMPKDCVYVLGLRTGNSSSSVSFRKCKIEIGNKATDWTPAPEDVQSQLDSHNTRISTAESSITQLTNSIALKVDTSEVYKKNEVDNLIKTGDLYVKGTGNNRPDSTIIRLNGNDIYNGRNRGLRLVTLKRSDLTVVDNMTYDVYISEDARNNLANKLNNLDDSVIVILASYDALLTNQALQDAIARCGGTGTFFGGSFFRVPYALVGIPNIGKGAGIEVFTSTDANAPYAEINTKIINGVPQGINTTTRELMTRMSSAELKITDSAIVSTVRTSNAYKNDLNEKVSADSIISTINQSAESITIQANKIGLLGETNIPDLTADKIKGGTLTLGGGTLGKNGEQIVYDVDGNAIIRIDKDGLVAYSGTINVVEIKEVVDPNNSVTTLYNQSTIKSEEFYAKYIKELGVGNPQLAEARIHAFDGLILKSQGSSYGFNDYNLKLMFDHVLYDISDYSYHKFSIGGSPKLLIKDTHTEIDGNLISSGSLTAGSQLYTDVSTTRRATLMSLIPPYHAGPWRIDIFDQTGLSTLGFKFGTNNDAFTITHTGHAYTAGNITISGYTAVDRHRGRTAANQFYIGDGNCRVDTSNGAIRLYTTAIGASSDTGIRVDANGTLNVIASGVTRHSFASNGTKSGGTIEVEGTTYGMSPIDSPQVLIEDVLFDVKVNGRTKIQLDNIFAKSISQYAVFSSCGQVQIVEKGADYFIVDGYTGVADFRIVGKRVNEEHRYFEIMGGFEHGVAEEVSI